MSTNSKPYMGFRATAELKKKSAAAQRKTGLRESELLRVALDEFFANHPTAESQISAVIANRTNA